MKIRVAILFAILYTSAGGWRICKTSLSHWINVLLIISTLIALLSGIMISNVVFRFLGIPYHEFWHYVHFVSGVAFLVFVIIHAFNHKRRTIPQHAECK